ncbi:lysine N(6)-hydroxylase/L-ornithine N(5)-oxygenase family protein [Cryobacterium sp. M15]|jgi:L-ornithine N5-oxygenase|uniref:lysine N(6)-hydroxylase/L-ornithine N(5)-oxygenase family protein n=1 Tax=Cryobacterium sp. M15 TaxID=2048291 RepID=UPI000CE40758|nr:SidA/IucD/PvdA family monooxygenase [Cryobacterium sp. M15]
MRDVIAVGLGPANLGLAAAIDEANRDGSALDALFVDRRSHFDWHPEMLLPSSVMQVSFLKDLVTQRNPNSPFSFISYLHARGRLNDFINRQTFFPSRQEFVDYLSWVSDSVSPEIRWRTEVTSIDVVDNVCVVRGVRDGISFEERARTVVLGIGSAPSLPSWARVETSRIIHNSRLRSGVAGMQLGPDSHVAVIGQGQSAAESIRFVLEQYPETKVSCFISGYGLVPADDSPYANRVFDPDAVDDFYFAPANVRDEILYRHRTTNYGCVDPDLIHWLYETEYAGKVDGTTRLEFRRASQILGASAHGNTVSLRVDQRMSNSQSVEEFDGVICATGFAAVTPTHLLGDSIRSELGVHLARDYRIIAGEEVLPIFAVGTTDSQHGLGAGLLSNIAVRSGEILASIVDAHSETRELFSRL